MLQKNVMNRRRRLSKPLTNGDTEPRIVAGIKACRSGFFRGRRKDRPGVELENGAGEEFGDLAVAVLRTEVGECCAHSTYLRNPLMLLPADLNKTFFCGNVASLILIPHQRCATKEMRNERLPHEAVFEPPNPQVA